MVGDDVRFKDVIGRSAEFLSNPSDNIKLFVSYPQCQGFRKLLLLLY